MATGVVISASPGRTARSRRRRTAPMAPFAGAVATAWALLLIAHITGSGDYLHHDAVLDAGGPNAKGLGLFLVGWLALVVAMMIPATWPALARRSTADREDDPSPAGFLGGFLLVWSVAGAAALAFDSSVHQAVHGVPALEARPWLVMVALLGFAGLVQLLPSTARHLRRGGLPLVLDRGGTAAWFHAGRAQGMRCLRADGPLMLVVFATGGALVWTVVGTVVMVAERLPRWHRAVATVAGVALLAAAVLTLLLSV